MTAPFNQMPRRIQPTHIAATPFIPFQHLHDESLAPTIDAGELPGADASHGTAGNAAYTSLLATASVRCSKAFKRKRAVDEDGSDVEIIEQKDAPSHCEGAAAAAPRPRRAASILAASHAVPLLQRRAQSVEAVDSSDEEDEDWQSEEEEKKVPTRRAPARRKAAATAKPASASNPSAGAAATPASAAIAPAAPLVPFIFNPQEPVPSAAARAASDLAVQRRFRTILADTQPVGPTTARQRNVLPKDLLLQRNLEVQFAQYSLDQQYDTLLQEKPVGWEVALMRLDEETDALADESDEIETILFEKHRVRGGGRTLIADEALEAAQYGASMADMHRQKGMPMPKLTVAADAHNEATGGAAAAASSNAAHMNESLSRSASAAAASDDASSRSVASSGAAAALVSSDAVPAGAVSAAAAAAVDEAMTSAASGGRMSKSDAAMWAKFDAEQEAIRRRQAERKEKAKDGLLAHYTEFFEKFIDVDRQQQPRKSATSRKPKVPQPPASFPLYLGTLVLPLFTDERVIRVSHVNDADASEERKDVAMLSPEAAADLAENAAAAPAQVTPSAPSAAALSSVPEEQHEEGTEGGEDVEEEDDEVVGEEVWLDFTHDASYVDGCMVKQVRPIAGGAGAASSEETETVTLGLLPLEGLHPPSAEEPELQFDEQGEPLPRRRVPRALPDPSRPLAALYVLHDGGQIIRLDSTLVRGDAEADSAASGDRVEISIYVNARIFSMQLLRSIAQKQALLTLFHLFSPPAEELDALAGVPVAAAADQLYPDAEGRPRAYAELSDAEQRAVALNVFIPPSIVQQAVVKAEPAAASDGVAPMEMDDDTAHAVADSNPIAVKQEPPLAVVAPAPASTLQLSLFDQTVAGDEIGESDEEEGEEDEEEDDGEDEEESEVDSADELFEEVVAPDRLVFVELQLPSSTQQQDASATVEATDDTAALAAVDEVKVKLEEGVQPSVSPDDVTKEEAAELAQLERQASKLEAEETPFSSSSGDKGNGNLSAEEQKLDLEQKRKWRPDTLHALFESIRPTPAWTARAAQPQGLQCTLRPFQQKALAWMEARESEATAVQEYDNPLWERVLLNGRAVWYQQFSGQVAREAPARIRDVRGGILAEEMGLGKTVEVIALVMKRPWTPVAPCKQEERSRDDDVIIIDGSPGEEQKEEAVAAPPAAPARTPIGATLIVSPMSLIYQWQKEAAKHAPSLRVFIYAGRKGVQSPEEAALHATENLEFFKQHDIVLVNYTALAQEVNYSVQCRHQLRGKKKYTVPSSPLLDCHWHRVILDEAQQVHSALSNCFKMAARLSCTSRFCVSGTPIGPQGLHDLYGLVSFLQVGPFDDAGTSAAVWRHCMQASTPAGLARLKTLLRRVMWRHSKAHVLAECHIPPLHQTKVLLPFTKIEREYYRVLERDCQSGVFFDCAQGRLVDASALRKLDSLRQACAHPQASAGGFLGAEVKSLPQIGVMLLQKAKDKETEHERELCRALNKLGIELSRQGKHAAAEEVFRQSWKVSDSGLRTDSSERTSHKPAAASTSRDKSSRPAVDASTAPTRSSSGPDQKKLLEDFESDVIIKTKNTEVRQWRIIDLVITKHLAMRYAQQLREQFGVEATPPLLTGRESCEATFQAILHEAGLLIPQESGGRKVYTAVADAAADAAAKALPPQLAAAAAAAGAAAPSSTSQSAAAAMSDDDEKAPEDSQENDSSDQSCESLLRKYRKQRDQFQYSLDDMLDLFALKLQDSAVLIVHTYENELLPQWLNSSLPEVRQLYAERQRVGVDKFNSAGELYMSKLDCMIKELQARQSESDDILTLYDLQRTRLLIEELQARLAWQPRRRLHEAIISQLKVQTRFKDRFLLVEAHSSQPKQKKKRAPPAKKDATPAKPGNKPPRTFDERLAKSYAAVSGAITKRQKRLGVHIVARLAEEDDMQSTDRVPGHRKHWTSYDNAWHRIRDSIQALESMREVRDQRRLMRTYTAKMLNHRCNILVEAGLLDGAESERWAIERAEELLRSEGDEQTTKQEEEEEEEQKSSSPKKKKPKREAGGAAAAASASPASSPSSPERFPTAAAAAASPASSRAFCDDSDNAVNIDALREAAIARLERDVAAARNSAIAQQQQVTWLKARFDMLSSSDAAHILEAPCAVCGQEIREPCLTVCGHSFCMSCLSRWISSNTQNGPSCPTCRTLLNPNDYAAFNRDELPAPIKHDFDMTAAEQSEERKPEVTQSADGATVPAAAAPHRRNSSAVPQSLSVHADAAAEEQPDTALSVSSTVAGSGGASLSGGASASGAAGLPRAEWKDVRDEKIVGEGQYGSKIEAVTKYIKFLRRHDPRVQVLVFSQFPRVLTMVATALKANAITYMQLQGTPDQRARQVERFQITRPSASVTAASSASSTDAPCTAFLLSLRHDNSGLTLVNATAVFLLEPSLNAGVEAQAVNRVHRIGQQRETHVYKLLMQGSLEQSIDAMAAREYAQQSGEELAEQNSASAATVAASGDALLQHSREAVSVKQLLQLLQLADESDGAAAHVAPTRTSSHLSRRSSSGAK